MTKRGIAITAVGALTAAGALLIWMGSSGDGTQTETAQAGAEPVAVIQNSESETPTESPDAEPQAAPEANPVPEGNAAPQDNTTTVGTASLIKKNSPTMGEAVTDGEGFALYRFNKDTANPSKSNCDGACAAKWPPLLTGSAPTLDGIDPALVGTVTRPDGTQQVTLNGWALYRFAGDKKPGDWKGQGVDGTWFVAAPDGRRNVNCLPPGVQAKP